MSFAPHEGQAPDEQLKTICFNSLRRARKTIKDFVLSYFPFHGWTPAHFLEHLDILVFVEGTIYRIDEEVEGAALAGADNPAASSPALAALCSVLEARGLMAAGVHAELQSGLAYWAEECRLGACMLRAPVVPPAGHGSFAGFTLEEVNCAAAKKSFDYRVLHHVLYAIRRAEPDTPLMEFLAVDETLLDLGDDIHDYEHDVVDGSFNIFRLYVHLFGLGAPLRLIEHISALEQRHALLLQQLPAILREQHLRRRAEAVEGEGALRWVLPSAILNESKFRSQHS